MHFMKLFSILLLISLWCIVTSQSGEETEEVEGEKEKLEKLQTAGLAFAKSFAAVLGLANPVAGAVVAVGIEIFEPLLEAFQGEQDIWDQIVGKVDHHIGKKLSKSELTNYRNLLFDFNRRIKKGDRFAVSDLDFIIGKMPAVIPFDTVLGWNYDLPLMMVLYFPYLIAGYQEILKKDKDLPVCALANDMNLYRSKVILGCKEMMKKRYKAIVSKTWKHTQDRCFGNRFKSRNRRDILGTNERCQVYNQIYEDNINGKLYEMKKMNGRAHKGSWEGVIQAHVQIPTVDYLFKNVIEKINKYFTSDICLKTQFNCKCPEPIRKDEIDIEWPRDCYGLDKCLFPAGEFGESYTWCYLKGEHPNWEYSERYDLDICIPIKRPRVKPLNILKRKPSQEGP